MTAATVRLLEAANRDSHGADVIVVEPEDSLRVGKYVNVDVLAVPHLPGAVGYVVRDARALGMWVARPEPALRDASVKRDGRWDPV